MAQKSTPFISKSSSSKDYKTAGVKKATTPTAPTITGGGSSKGKTSGVIVVRTDSLITDIKSGQQLTTGQGVVNIDGGSKAGGQSIRITAPQGQEFAALSNQIQQTQRQVAAQRQTQKQQETNYIDFSYGKGDSPSMYSDAGRLYMSEGFKNKLTQAQAQEKIKAQNQNPMFISYNEQFNKKPRNNKKDSFLSLTSKKLKENPPSVLFQKGSNLLKVNLTPYEESIGKGQKTASAQFISKSIYKTTDLTFNLPSNTLALGSFISKGIELEMRGIEQLRTTGKNPYPNFTQDVKATSSALFTAGVVGTKNIFRNTIQNPSYYIPEYASTGVSFLATGKIFNRLTEFRPFGSVVTGQTQTIPKATNINKIDIQKTKQTIYGAVNNKNVPLFDVIKPTQSTEIYPMIRPAAKITKVEVTKALIKQPVKRLIDLTNGKAELVTQIPSVKQTKFYVRLPKVKQQLVVEGRTVQIVKTNEAVFTDIQKQAKFKIEIPKETPTQPKIKITNIKLDSTPTRLREVEILTNLPITKITKQPTIFFGSKFSTITASGRTARVYDLFDTPIIPNTLKGLRVQRASKGFITEAYNVATKTSQQIKTKGLAMNIPLLDIQTTTTQKVTGGAARYNPTIKLNIIDNNKFFVVPNINNAQIQTTQPKTTIDKIQNSKYTFGQLPTQTFKQTPESRITSDSLLKQSSALKQSPQLKQDLSLKQNVALKQTLALKQSLVLKQIPTLRRPPEFPMFSFKQDSTPRRITKGFDVIFLERGKKVKGNIKPLAYEEALNFGRDIAENSISASFKLVPTGFSVPMGSRQQFARGSSVSSFNFLKGMSRRTSGFYVEKNTFRINTQGEKKGLSVAKALSLYGNRQNVFKPNKLFKL